MAGVNPVAQRDTSLLTTVMKGLQIAQSVYGIKSDMAKIEALDREQARQAEMDTRRMQFEDEDRAAKQAAEAQAKSERERVSANRLNPGEQRQLAQQGFGEAKPGERGAFSFVDSETGLTKWVKKLQAPAIRQPPDQVALGRLALEREKFAYQQKQDQQKSQPSLANKVAGLNGDAKSRFDNATLALKSARDMADALLTKNQDTFKVWGDNDFTIARTQWEEAIGRMQSGGAIQDDEAERFRNMAPTWRDNPQTQEKKLVEMQAIMEQRIANLGIDPAEALAEINKRREGIRLPKRASGEGEAVAAPRAPAAPISEEDAKAQQWLMMNPEHPDAPAVQAALRAKGVIE